MIALGFLADGDLYIAGRRKDLVILRGRNHHPQDPQDFEEWSWKSHAALRPGRVAAFAVDGEGETEEALVIVQEVFRDAARVHGLLDAAEITARVRSNVARVHGLALSRLVLVSPGQVPRTSSGFRRGRASTPVESRSSWGSPARSPRRTNAAASLDHRTTAVRATWPSRRHRRASADISDID